MSETSKFKELKVSFNKILNTKILPLFAKIAAQRHLMAIRNGIASVMAFVLVGATALLIVNFPLSGESGGLVLKDLMPVELNNMLFYIYGYSMGLMGLYAAWGIGAELGKSYGFSPVTTGSLSTFAFLLLIVPTEGSLIPMGLLGGSSLFGSIIAALISIEIYHLCKRFNITIKMPSSVPKAISDAFAILVPVIIVAILFGVVRYIIGFDLINFMSIMLAPLTSFMTDNFFGVILVIIFVTTFWWMGIHGQAMVETFARSFWQTALDENSAAWLDGETSPPNTYPEPFLQWFVWIGGAGATLGLIICALLFSKSAHSKAISKSSAVPALFNINEPVIFGFPIMLNPILFIPFLFAPLMMAISGALLMQVFSIHFWIGVSWTLPGPLGAYFATGANYWAILVAFINIGISTLIWYPFFRVFDNQKLKEENLFNTSSKKVKTLKPQKE